jgi:hypothetical protein
MEHKLHLSVQSIYLPHLAILDERKFVQNNPCRERIKYKDYFAISNVPFKYLRTIFRLLQIILPGAVRSL